MRGSTDGDVRVRRLAAFLLDHLVILIYLAALAALGLVLIRLGLTDRVAGILDSPWKGQALGLFLVTLPWVMYHASWEASPLAATPGKLLLGLRVTGTGNEPIPMERAVLRSMFKFAPWELAHALLWRIPGWPGPVEALSPATTLGLGLVWILVAAYLGSVILQGGHRTVYDHWSGTRISRAASPSRATPRGSRRGVGSGTGSATRGFAVGPFAPMATEFPRRRGVRR